jgi:hypothetical protein
VSDATVLRESTNDGYYMVLPSIGKGEVEAIDMQRAGFSAKAKATIIQIGSEYGIVSKLKGLTGVLAVPADSRVAVALKNPAQFALAYFATLLGNIKRAYAVAEVLSVGAKTMLLKYAGGIDNGKQFYAAPMAGLKSSDFEAGEMAVISLLQVEKPAVCGWWSAGISPIDGLRIFNIDLEQHSFYIPFRKNNGDPLTYTDAMYLPYQKSEIGFYDTAGALGEVGVFYPFKTKTEQIDGSFDAINTFDPDDNDEWCALSSDFRSIRFGNEIKLTYEILGESRKRVTFSAMGEFEITDSAMRSEFGGDAFSEITSALIHADGSVEIVFFTVSTIASIITPTHTKTFLDYPQNYAKCKLGDFYGQAVFKITMPVGSIFPPEPPEMSSEIIRGSGGVVGNINLTTGVFSLTSSEGGWQVYGTRAAGPTKSASMTIKLDGEIIGVSAEATIDLFEAYVEYVGSTVGARFFPKKYTPEAV